MKKVAWAAIAAAGILMLAGCGNKPVNNSAETGSKDTGAAKTESKTDSGGIISSIKDAMGLGTTMECTYKVKGINGKDFVSTAYVKGNNYKMTNVVNGKKEVNLYDGKTAYSWVEGEKTGTKMDIACLDDLNKNTQDKSDYKSTTDQNLSPEEEFKDAVDTQCKPTGNVDLSVPSDVKFADQCEVMKNFLQSEPDQYDTTPVIPESMKIK